MRTLIILKTVVVVFGISLLGCSKEGNPPKSDNLSDSSLVSTQYPLFDSLQGEWQWYNTYDAKKGLIENGFEAVIKFLSVNQDSSINFQTIKEGTIYKSGKITISQSKFGYKVSQNIVPNYTAIDEIYFKFSTTDSISFFEDCNDCPIYYYKILNY